MKIKFKGFDGQVIEKSPHGNYLVIELSDEITICGTFTNIWNWEESPEIESGFISFITYIGCNHDDLETIYEWIENHDGYFRESEREPRASKRNQYYPLEIKIRGLTPDSVIELIDYLK